MKLMNWMIWFPICLFLLVELLPIPQMKDINPAEETKTKVVLISQVVESPIAQYPTIPSKARPISSSREEMLGDMLLGLGLGTGMVQKNVLLLLGLSLSLLMILIPTQAKVE